jgi:hypothetical protein
MADYRQFQNALGGVVEARFAFDRFLLDLGLDFNQYGEVYTRTKGDRDDHLRARLMLEATFKAMKHLQHGAEATLRDAMSLWAEAVGEGSLLALRGTSDADEWDTAAGSIASGQPGRGG